MSDVQENGTSDKNVDADNQRSTAPPRELTQTDRLNKKLLMSLFDRMTKGDEAIQRMMQPNENKQQTDSWDTSPGDFSPK